MLMTRHFDYCPSASEGDNQSVRSSAPVVSRCFPGGYNVKLYISRGKLAWWLLAFLCCNRSRWKRVCSSESYLKKNVTQDVCYSGESHLPWSRVNNTWSTTVGLL